MPNMRLARSSHLIRAWLIGGLVVVLLGVLWVSGRHTATTYSVEGWAAPNSSGTAIWLNESEGGDSGEGYVIAGARWSEPGVGWHQGILPTCVGTDTSSRIRVRLGLVDVDSEHGGWTQVIWLQCLGSGGGR
jgi:hypothetical protein